MKKIIPAVLALAFFLAGCGQQGMEFAPGISSEAAAVSFDSLAVYLEEQGMEWKEADLPKEYALNRMYNGVSPETFIVDGNRLAVYVFPSVASKEQGMRELEAFVATETFHMETYKTYTAKNIVLFYVGGDEAANKKLSKALKKLM